MLGRVREGTDSQQDFGAYFFFFATGFALAFGLAFAFAGALAAGLALGFALPFAAAGFAVAGFASLPLASFASVFASFGSSDLLGAASSRSAKLRFFSSSDLKSVSYQPSPFKRKTGAETSFFSVCFLQLGHCFSGASLIFCRAST